jgi:hypothetical protein
MAHDYYHIGTYADEAGNLTRWILHWEPKLYTEFDVIEFVCERDSGGGWVPNGTSQSGVVCRKLPDREADIILRQLVQRFTFEPNPSTRQLQTALASLLVPAQPHTATVSPVRWSPEQSCSAPPVWGEYLLCLFIPLERQDDTIGDLEEGYYKREAKFGHCKAVIWYWMQVVLSLRPLIPRAVKGLLLATLGHWLGLSSRVGDWLIELRHWIGKLFL